MQKAPRTTTFPIPSTWGSLSHYRILPADSNKVNEIKAKNIP
jgi:hypothetical protein